MHKRKLGVATAIASATILATISAGFLLAPTQKDDLDHHPIIVTSKSSLKLDTLGGSAALMSRMMFATPSELSFSSSDENVCTVSDGGLITATGDGAAIVTVSALDDDGSHLADKTIDVEVERADQSLTTEWNWKGMLSGSSVQLPATATSNLPIEYVSSDDNIATVSEDGTITAKSPGTAIITARQTGDQTWKPAESSASITVAEGAKDRRAALEPFYQAMEEQQKWSWNASYGGGQVTIENSKTIGNCTTFPTASLQRVGLLEEHTIVWPHSRHAKKHPEYFELYEVNEPAASLIKNGKLLPGDIVRYKGPKPSMHSMVYVGQDENGKPLFNSAGRVCGPKSNRAKLFCHMSTYANANIHSILRIKTYPVSVTWDGEGMAGGGGEVMAKQDCTVTFEPAPGSTLSKLIVDGTELPITPDMNSYTFEDVLEPHSIEITFSTL